MPPPKVFIASPLFSPPQLELIGKIEDLLEKFGYSYYSARKHSGSDKLSPDEKKVLSNWDPVYASNIQGLNECRVMIAVLEYAMPKDTYLAVCSGSGVRNQIEVPDAGTVFEIGYHQAQGKLVLGFHSDVAKKMNLMVSHGVEGLIKGFDALEGFLANGSVKVPSKLAVKADKVRPMNPYLIDDAILFDWKYTGEFDAATKEVE